jgi:hypothetical protein
MTPDQKVLLLTLRDAINAAVAGITTADQLPEPGTVEKRTTPAPSGYVACKVLSSAQRDFDGGARVWLMELAAPTGEVIRWRCPADNGTITSIARKALGLLGDIDPSAAEGRTAVVKLGSFTGRDGTERPCVTRWHLPPKPAEDAPQPESETDQLPLHQQAAEQPAKPKQAPPPKADDAARIAHRIAEAMDAAGGADDWDGIPF